MQALQRKLRTIVVCFLAWTGVGLFFFTQSMAQKIVGHYRVPTSYYLWSWLAGVYISALGMPVIFWLGRRFPIERRNWPRRAAFHVVFAMLLSAAELALQAAVLRQLGVFPNLMDSFAHAFRLLMTGAFHQNFVSCLFLLGMEHTLRYYRGYQDRTREALRLELQASELKTQLVRAQLSALNMQLQPHFLFNTLNAVMVLVRQRKAREAEDMLGRLSDLLRSVLDGGDAQEVPLRQELDYLRQYLAIEQVRFQDRLGVEILADSAVLEAAVPYMGLQPLVENAIRHGIGGSSAAGVVRIVASRLGDAVQIRIQDDGPGLDRAVVRPNAIGLSNTRERLRQLYGGAASLALENGYPCGAVATLTLPYRATSPDRDRDTGLLELDAVSCTDRR